jgi:hypothetical protein
VVLAGDGELQGLLLPNFQVAQYPTGIFTRISSFVRASSSLSNPRIKLGEFSCHNCCLVHEASSGSSYEMMVSNETRFEALRVSFVEA